MTNLPDQIGSTGYDLARWLAEIRLIRRHASELTRASRLMIVDGMEEERALRDGDSGCGADVEIGKSGGHRIESNPFRSDDRSPGNATDEPWLHCSIEIRGRVISSALCVSTSIDSPCPEWHIDWRPPNRFSRASVLVRQPGGDVR